MSSTAALAYTFAVAGGFTAAQMNTLVAAVSVLTPDQVSFMQLLGLNLLSDATINGPPVKRTITYKLVPDADATATATLFAGDPTGSAIKSLTLGFGGTNYAVPPDVSFAPPPAKPGRSAQAKATLDVSSLALTFGGGGYITPPPVTFVGGLPRDGSGVLPTAHTTLLAGVVNAIILDTPGSGLIGQTVPVIGPSPAGTGSNATATAVMQVDALHLLDGGSGYVAATPPAVVLMPHFKTLYPDSIGVAAQARVFADHFTALFAKVLHTPLVELPVVVA
jgi:hypothetical protein